MDQKQAAKVDATKVTCPVLVAAGAQDRITPAPVVCKVARKYQTVSTYKELPDHGHWLLDEPGWEKTATHVADWLSASLDSGTKQ